MIDICVVHICAKSWGISFWAITLLFLVLYVWRYVSRGKETRRDRYDVLFRSRAMSMEYWNARTNGRFGAANLNARGVPPHNVIEVRRMFLPRYNFNSHLSASLLFVINRCIYVTVKNSRNCSECEEP